MGIKGAQKGTLLAVAAASDVVPTLLSVSRADPWLWTEVTCAP